MKNLKLFVPFLIFLVLAFFLLKGLEKDPGAMPSALIDRPVPAFALPDLFQLDRSVDESVFRGHVSLLNVWATWCPSCRHEHPFLTELAGKGVRIIGMDYKDRTDLALDWLDRLGNPYAVTFIDPAGKLGVDLGVFGAPETYLVDHRGIIRAKHVGVVNEEVWATLGKQYRQLVEEMNSQ